MYIYLKAKDKDFNIDEFLDEIIDINDHIDGYVKKQLKGDKNDN